MYWLLLFIGFVILIKGADWMVEGASSLATRLGIPLIIVGLTIVAFGTSAPELVVNIVASAKGEGNLALGNVVGSNISNLFFVLAVTSLYAPLVFRKNLMRIDIPLSFFGCLLLAGLGILAGTNDKFILSQLSGLLLLFVFIGYMIYLFRLSKSENSEEDQAPEMTVPKAILWTVIGLVGLILGGQWVVHSASKIAYALADQMGWEGVDQVLGLTVVALGTSLPELVASVVATKKGKSDLAVGNIVGSNIFNVLWVVGASAIMKPLEANIDFYQDLGWCLGATLLVWIFLQTPKRGELNKIHGITMISLYGLYIYFLVSRL